MDVYCSDGLVGGWKRPFSFIVIGIYALLNLIFIVLPNILTTPELIFMLAVFVFPTLGLSAWRTKMRKPILLGSLYTLFLLWQNRWFSQPLSEAEVDTYLNKMAPSDKHETPLQDEERANARAFFLADDSKPFYMVNLMQYREKAVYPQAAPRSKNRTGSQRPLQQSRRQRAAQTRLISRFPVAQNGRFIQRWRGDRFL